MLAELNEQSQDDNAASLYFQNQDTLGNPQATSFGSLRCQVKVRGREQDPPAVYLKKGKWVKSAGLGPQWPSSANVGSCFPAGCVWGSYTTPSPLHALSSASPCRVPITGVVVFGPQRRIGRPVVQVRKGGVEPTLRCRRSPAESRLRAPRGCLGWGSARAVHPLQPPLRGLRSLSLPESGQTCSQSASTPRTSPAVTLCSGPPPAVRCVRIMGAGGGALIKMYVLSQRSG